MGPELYPYYTLVVAIVMVAVTLSLGVAFAVSWIAGDVENLGSLAWSFVKALFQGGLSAFAGVTVVFAIIERISGGKFEKEDETDWNPLELAPNQKTGSFKSARNCGWYRGLFHTHHPL